MSRFIGLFLLGLFATGCAHASGKVRVGGQGEDGEVSNGHDIDFRSYDPEKMVTVASQATVNVMNAETCRIAVENGRSCSTTGMTAGSPYGVGMVNTGYGAPGGLGTNVAGRLFHGNAFGGAVTPQYVVQVPVPVGVQTQAGTSQNDAALREELANVRALAERADKKGAAAIDATKRVVERLSTMPARSVNAPPATVPAPAAKPAAAPTSDQAPSQESNAVNLPPP